MKMKILAHSVLVLSFLFFFASTLHGCTCSDYHVPTCAEFDRADAVFVGKIEQVSRFNPQDQNVSFPSVNSISTTNDSGLVLMEVKVEQAFKGVEGKTARVTTYQGTSCDIGEVKKGQRWIFFAYRNDESGILGVGACNATSQITERLSEYKDYFAELEQLAKGKFGTFVKGSLIKDAFVGEGQQANVSIEGDNFFSTNPTNNGSFSFQVPKAGKHKVRITVPFSAVFDFNFKFTNFTKNTPTETETVFEYEIDAEENKCNYYQIQTFPIDLKATAKISGKFIPKDWSFFPKFYPELCKLKDTEEETLKSCNFTHSLKMDGSFEIKGLREGKYTLVINDDNFPDGSNPFWRHYYPGVKEFKDARPIILEQGQTISDIKFNLPQFFPRREIKGQVFWKDGKTVTFNPENDEYLNVYLYSFEKPDKMIFMNSFLTEWDDFQEKKKTKMVSVNPDGTFNIMAFDGFKYWIDASFSLPNGKTKCGFYKLEISENTIQPIKIFLDRTDNCNTEDYVKELERKSKNKKP